MLIFSRQFCFMNQIKNIAEEEAEQKIKIKGNIETRTRRINKIEFEDF